MSIRRALEEKLLILRHRLRVTRHHPEPFLVHFDFPAHRDAGVRRGALKVDGANFLLKAWWEDDHATHQNFNLHVRVVIERLTHAILATRGGGRGHRRQGACRPPGQQDL